VLDLVVAEVALVVLVILHQGFAMVVMVVMVLNILSVDRLYSMVAEAEDNPGMDLQFLQVALAGVEMVQETMLLLQMLDLEKLILVLVEEEEEPLSTLIVKLDLADLASSSSLTQPDKYLKSII